MVEFTDFTVKLLAIDALLESGEIEAPFASGDDWLQAARGIEWEQAQDLIYGEYFELMIPEAETWARELQLTAEQLATIESLEYDGGLEIFDLLCPSWGGETDLFDPTTWVDVTPERFPNLKDLTFTSTMEPEVLATLEAAGVECDEF